MLQSLVVINIETALNQTFHYLSALYSMISIVDNKRMVNLNYLIPKLTIDDSDMVQCNRVTVVVLIYI